MSRRRGNGEGSITQRKDGTWQARVRLPNGKRKYVYAKTRKEVALKLREVLTARDEGRIIATGRQTTEQYLRTWFDGHKTTIRPSTTSIYELLLEKHAYPGIGHIKLSRLDVHHLEALYAQKIRDGLSTATVRQLHAVLRIALGKAAKVGTIPRNVAALATPPRVQKVEIKALDEDQARALLKAVEGDRFEAFFILSLSTGMRVGELLALRWEDCDLQNGFLQVRHTLSYNRKGGGWRLGEPKSARSRRRIALSKVGLEGLLTHRARQAEERLFLGPAWNDHGFVFTDTIGNPVRANNLRRRAFAKALKTAKLPASVRMHDLRHTAATLLLKQNVHIKVVSELLGHASTSFTMDRYSHVLPTLQAEAAKAMDTLLLSGE